MVDPTVDNDRWHPLAEAARVLGVSEKTVRRRAKAGQLDARQVPTQHGPAWQVRLPDGVPTGDRVDPVGTQAQTTAMLELIRLVGELQPKAEAAAMWQARAELLAERLAVAEHRIAALAAPVAPQAEQEGQGEPEPPDPSPEPLTPAPTPLEPDRNGTVHGRAWWRRWLSAVYGW